MAFEFKKEAKYVDFKKTRHKGEGNSISFQFSCLNLNEAELKLS